MLVPGAPTFRGWRSSEVYHGPAGLLSERGPSRTSGTRGGFAPSLAPTPARRATVGIDWRRPLPRRDRYALDPATGPYMPGATSSPREGRLAHLGRPAELWSGWADRYPIVSIEDGHGEDDWRAGAASRAPSATACSRGRRRCLDEHRALSGASRSGGGRPILSSSTNRHPHEASTSTRALRGLRRHLPPLRRDLGHTISQLVGQRLGPDQERPAPRRRRRSQQHSGFGGRPLGSSARYAAPPRSRQA